MICLLVLLLQSETKFRNSFSTVGTAPQEEVLYPSHFQVKLKNRDIIRFNIAGYWNYSIILRRII